ncbi:MAG: tRNA pseudouridine(13) synthase TruD, partial [Gammaproteobacteria bacterium RBG_16_57_12]
VLGFEPGGQGEHVLLHIRKRNQNTEWVARQLARIAQVPAREVSYSGLKDKQALTTQWFSVSLPGKAMPDWSALTSADIEILRAERHQKKLRRGSHHANRFRLVLRRIIDEPGELEQRLQQIADQGVPNYFGEQRFGRNGNNLRQAWRLFTGEFREKDRHKRGLYLSAARAMLFNQVLSRRVVSGTWNKALAGDLMSLAGSNSVFAASVISEEIMQRVAAHDIHPSGPLWGRGELGTRGEVAVLEQQVLERFAPWCRGLEQAGLQQERRPLRLQVAELGWQWLDDTTLALEFQLPRGAYATAVVRELMQVGDEGATSHPGSPE